MFFMKRLSSNFVNWFIAIENALYIIHMPSDSFSRCTIRISTESNFNFLPMNWKYPTIKLTSLTYKCISVPDHALKWSNFLLYICQEESWKNRTKKSIADACCTLLKSFMIKQQKLMLRIIGNKFEILSLFSIFLE